MSVRHLARSATPGPQRILMVMLGQVAEAVHALPVAAALKRAWPESKLTWIVQRGPELLVRKHRLIDQLLVFRHRPGLGSWQSFQEVALCFPRCVYDLLLVVRADFETGVLTALTPARAKLGFDRARARQLAWLFTHEQIEPRGHRHVQDEYFEFLEYLGIDPHPAIWDLCITEEEWEAQAAFFANLDLPACAIVLGASDPRKNWNVPGYARLLEELQDRWKLQPILVGGSSAVEREMADRILASSKARPLHCLGDDLRRVVWIIAGSALTISPDTGPLHISRALETPVVGLYGRTNPKRTGPYRLYHDLVVDGYAEFQGEAYPVSPTPRDGMNRVTVDLVLAKVELAMKKYVAC